MPYSLEAAILTPPERLQAIIDEFGPIYDPCPFPRPECFDGLVDDWKSPAYCNPPFGKGMTAWVRKGIKEHGSGKTVIFALPVDGWIRLLIQANAEIRTPTDWYWLRSDGTKCKPSRPLLLWVLK
jgi:hypothetical protein